METPNGYSNRELRMTNIRGAKYKGKEVFWYEIMRANCPICGHSGNCMINSLGTQVVCTRVPSKKIFSKKNRSYIHDLKTTYHISKKNNSEFKEFSVRSVNDLNKVYEIVLDYYKLSSNHIETLIQQRKLTLNEIYLRKYGSFIKSKPQALGLNNGVAISVWEKLFKEAGLPEDIWKGVPGFYERRYSYGKKSCPWFNCQDGILIPFRDSDFNIVGLQVRVDRQTIDVTYEQLHKNLQIYKPQFAEVPIVEVVEYESGEEILLAKIYEDKENLKFSYLGQEYSLRIKRGPKYLWVSTSNYYGGSSFKAPIHYAFSYEKLSVLNKSSRLSQVNPYKEIINNVWVTEGALKGDIIASFLPKAYSEFELRTKHGLDVLCVAGVSQWQLIVDEISAMKYQTVTLAFDMDFTSNDQVKLHYESLIRALLKQGKTIYIAVWDETLAKGLDDLFALNLRAEFRRPK